jgi:hypothetical protein
MEVTVTAESGGMIKLARAGHYAQQFDESTKNLSVDIVGYRLSICFSWGVVTLSL